MFLRLVRCLICGSLLILIVNPAIASPLPSPRFFVDWCRQRQQLPHETTATIAAILSKLGTKDCQIAQNQLQTVTALRITELSPYATKVKPIAKPLSYLSLDMPFILDLRPLVVAMPRLQQLDLSNTQSVSLTPLRAWTQLEDLNLTNTQLRDVAPLANLTNLVRLNISHNQVKDLTEIATLKDLQQFDFSHNQIRDLRVLAALPKLFSIRFTNNPVDVSTCLGKWASACEGGE